MDISLLKRNAEKVQASLTENKNHELITKTGCTIYVPTGYTDKGLAIISSEVSIVGIYAIVIDDKYYGVSKATTMLTIVPTTIDTILIDDEEYFKFDFEPGSVVVRNTMAVRDKKLVNYIMDYFIDYGHSPWFITYLDHAELFRDAKYFNDIRLSDNQAVFDIITAHISRDPKKFEEYYRHTAKSGAVVHEHPRFIATRDIANNTTSNLARINGSELQRAIKSALTAEPKRAEPLEELYMK